MILLESTEILFASVLAIVLGGFIKGAIGFGLPFIATPVMILYLPLAEVVSLLILPVLSSNFQQCWATRSSAGIMKTIWPMITVNFAVLLVGSYLFLGASSTLTQAAIGFLIILHALVGDKTMPISAQGRHSGILMSASGLVSGMLGSVSSFYSFPSVQALYSSRISPEAFVFAIGTLLSSGFIALWLGVFLQGSSTPSGLLASAAMVIPATLGMWLGNQARDRLQEQLFRVIVRIMLIATGVGLLAKSLDQLAT